MRSLVAQAAIAYLELAILISSMDEKGTISFLAVKVKTSFLVERVMTRFMAVLKMINGGSGNDQIFASEGNNTIDGGFGNDIIYSGSGSDRINGGMGSDTIWLGGGQDIVVLTRGFGVDTIHNFQVGQTRIGLADGLTFSSLTITQGRDAAEIKIGSNVLVSISWVQASSLDASSFVVV